MQKLTLIFDKTQKNTQEFMNLLKYLNNGKERMNKDKLLNILLDKKVLHAILLTHAKNLNNPFFNPDAYSAEALKKILFNNFNNFKKNEKN